MKEEDRQFLRKAVELSSVGFTLVLATFGGLLIGVQLDKWTGLKPLFTIVMLLFGIFSGFVYLIYKFGANGKK